MVPLNCCLCGVDCVAWILYYMHTMNDGNANDCRSALVAVAIAACRLSSALLAVFAPIAAHAALRPPAVPLVAVEPHFSVWSAADRLYDKDTTHWSGVAQPLTILLDADGTTYRLCGRGRGKDVETPVLQQTGLRVGATTTSYSFSDGKGLSAEVDFITPRMTDDLDVFSRPVT